VDAEFIQQLCAEQLVTRRNRHGFSIREWQKMRERNEALDCYVYARAAASLAGLDRFEERHWRELEKQLGIPEPQPLTQPIIRDHNDIATSESTVAKDAKRSRRLIRSRWIG
jgi:phage terminase large subunit GpA-like protein